MFLRHTYYTLYNCEKDIMNYLISTNMLIKENNSSKRDEIKEMYFNDLHDALKTLGNLLYEKQLVLNKSV